MLSSLLVFASLFVTATGYSMDEARPIRILFLGDNGHHQPAQRFRDLQPVLAARGIELTYSEDTNDLNSRTLAGYDGLLIYANTTRITPDQEKALLEFVEQGHGFVPLHCASYCFLNSPKYVDLVGAQFLKHGTGTVHTTIAQPEHPVMNGFKGFSSWDETYVHTKHNEKDRSVLEYLKRTASKNLIWIRTQEKADLHGLGIRSHRPTRVSGRRARDSLGNPP